MTPSQVRADLLGEHFELRRLIEEAREILRSGDDATRIELPAAVDRLANVLFGHSQHEEAALRVLLPTVQGRVHADAVMDERHVAEHARLVAVLRAAVIDAEASAVQEKVGALLDELESHMAEEEEVLLGEDLLGDEVDGADAGG